MTEDSQNPAYATQDKLKFEPAQITCKHPDLPNRHNIRINAS